MKTVALLLSIIPGLSQLYRGRLYLGAILFVLFLFASNGAAALLLFFQNVSTGFSLKLFFLMGGMVWLFNMAETLRRTVFWNEEKRRAIREDLFRKGVRLYLEGLFQEACQAFSSCLRLDPKNPDILIYLGMVKRNQGDFSSAKRFLNRCRKRDIAGKWSQEVDEEERKIAKACQNDSKT